MSQYGLFRKGDLVQVVNEENYLYEEIGEIRSIGHNGRFFIRLADGQETIVSSQEIAPWLGSAIQKQLYKAHLFQLQSLAVDISDRQWFEEIGKIIDTLDP